MAWHKTSRHERGYGSDWTKIRARILARDCGLCQVCRKAGRVTLATEVDHITGKAQAKRLHWTTEQVNADENLQAICNDCHKRKTAEENGKTYKPRPTIGADGWPIEGNQ